MPVSRTDHLEWCKSRALEYVEIGDLQGALASMTSDLGKHEGTLGSVDVCMLGIAHMSSKAEMRSFIEGFS